MEPGSWIGILLIGLPRGKYTAMKVLDLECALGHCFEGWFGSEADFAKQHDQSMVQCPICGETSVTKKLSAPRLNLMAGRGSHLGTTPVGVELESDAMTRAWFEVARAIVANTTDVGSRFAEEARRMHYQEADERNIRGTTTADEVHALLDEGIDVMPFVMPEQMKNPLQ